MIHLPTGYIDLFALAERAAEAELGDSPEAGETVPLFGAALAQIAEMQRELAADNELVPDTLRAFGWKLMPTPGAERMDPLPHVLWQTMPPHRFSMGADGEGFHVEYRGEWYRVAVLEKDGDAWLARAVGTCGNGEAERPLDPPEPSQNAEVPDQVAQWMERHTSGPGKKKRDPSIEDCRAATGCTYRKALAAWNALPADRKRSPRETDRKLSGSPGSGRRTPGQRAPAARP